MLSFRSIVEAHTPLLWIDSASTQVQVGVLRAEEAAHWVSSAEEAGIGIFSCVEKALRETGVALSGIGAFVFCEGPGSVLGIRLAATAIRTWCVLHDKPVFAYSSLTLVAEALSRGETARNVRVIADARRDTWHEVAVNAQGLVSPLHRVTTTELTGELTTPDVFKHWTPLPPQTRRVGYSLAELLRPAVDAPLLSPSAHPEAFLHEEPSYKTWTPQVHRAPV